MTYWRVAIPSAKAWIIVFEQKETEETESSLTSVISVSSCSKCIRALNNNAAGGGTQLLYSRWVE
jgi:hypothetical protein